LSDLSFSSGVSFSENLGTFAYQDGLTGISSVNISGNLGYDSGAFFGLVSVFAEGTSILNSINAGTCFDGFFSAECSNYSFNTDVDASDFSYFTDGETDMHALFAFSSATPFTFSDLTLTIEADAIPAVPLPAGLPLAAGAFGLFGLLKRRKARA
jgi:hypothetical protein